MKVRATSDKIKQYIKHPSRRIGFRADGTAEWPHDQFTQRRINDGDVTVVEAEPKRLQQPHRKSDVSVAKPEKSEKL
jgi:hypothetical protein